MKDYDRIAHIIHYLNERHTEQPSLAILAKQAGLSPFHFHRLFSRWAGITPKEFLQSLTYAHAKAMLRKGESVLDTALEAGLSGPGRLHDLCVRLEAATPGEIKAGGTGWVISAGFSQSPFGLCLLAEGPRGICHLSFPSSKEKNRGVAKATLQQEWPQAKFEWNNERAARLSAPLFAEPGAAVHEAPLRSYVRGTGFQIRVWRALLQIPRGSVISYGQLANALGQPGAARAVGTAVSRNPLAYLIPCHRVIRQTGVLGEYRWDPIRKKAMLAWESVHRQPAL